MRSTVLSKALARMTTARVEQTVAHQIMGDLYKRGVRFPTGKVHNVVMPMFEEEHLKLVEFVLRKHGMKQMRSEKGEIKFSDGADREATLYTAVPDYHTGLIGLMLV